MGIKPFICFILTLILCSEVNYKKCMQTNFLCRIWLKYTSVSDARIYSHSKWKTLIRLHTRSKSYLYCRVGALPLGPIPYMSPSNDFSPPSPKPRTTYYPLWKPPFPLISLLHPTMIPLPFSSPCHITIKQIKFSLDKQTFCIKFLILG